MVNFKTENSCAVVTGGGDGMGLQIALALVSNGCSVCICDISQQRLDAAAAQLHASVTKEHAGNIIISTKVIFFLQIICITIIMIIVNLLINIQIANAFS